MSSFIVRVSECCTPAKQSSGAVYRFAYYLIQARSEVDAAARIERYVGIPIHAAGSSYLWTAETVDPVLINISPVDSIYVPTGTSVTFVN